MRKLEGLPGSDSLTLDTGYHDEPQNQLQTIKQLKAEIYEEKDSESIRRSIIT